MGTLRRLADLAVIQLLPEHLVGRSDRADLRIDDRSVSSDHAKLRWTGRSWVVRDLGSKNGTWADGERLAAGASRALAEGATLGFGDGRARYRLEEAGPPVVSAVDDRGVRHFGMADLLALPDATAPELVIVGDGEAWRVEGEAGVRDLVDGEVLTLGQATFRVTLPEVPSATWDRDSAVGASLADVALHFRVSLDEEHVELAVSIGDRRVELGSRAHHYLLLTLARLRLQDDADPALPRTSCGWVPQDRLLKMLGTRSGALHLAVFRARSELAELGVAGAPGLVERRKAAQQVRIGVSAITIEQV